MAAYAACEALGLSHEAIVAAMLTFPGLAHRMEQVGRLGKVLFVNDSKATNADSAEKALAAFSDIYWIAGGTPKEGGIAPLAAYFPRIAKSYLIGKSAEDFAVTLGATLMSSPARSTGPSPWPPPMLRRAAPRIRSCCSRRPAPATTSSRTSRSAARLPGSRVLHARDREDLIPIPTPARLTKR